MTRWFRMYDEVVNDPKVLCLSSDALRWQWVAVLCIASKNGGKLPSIAHVGITLRIAPQRAAAVLAELHKAQLLDKLDDGSFVPHNWDGRQYKTKGQDDPHPEKDGKARYIYFLAGATSGVVKIGISRNPWARIGELQTGHPEKLSVQATFKTRGPSEADLHLLLDKYRMHGEWFNLPQEIMAVVVEAHASKVDYVMLLRLLRSEITTNDRSSYVADARTDTDTDTDTEQKQKDSEAIASDASASDPRTRLFREGLAKIAAMTGKGPDSCRSFLGKCLKAADDDAVTVLGLIEDAERNRVVNPAAWIAARLKPKENPDGRRTVHQAADEALERLRAFNEPAPSGLRDGTREDAIRLIPAR